MRRVRRANLLLHLGDLAVDALQAEAEGVATGLGEGQVWDSIEQSAGGYGGDACSKSCTSFLASSKYRLQVSIAFSALSFLSK